MTASLISPPPGVARTAWSDLAPVVRAPVPVSRRRSSLFDAINSGAARVMPSPGLFFAAHVGCLAWLCITGLQIWGVAASCCACLAVASSRLSERRANAAREPSE